MYDIEMFRYKYVGICAGIKALSFLIFCFDWWLINKRQLKEEEGGMTMGEVVNSMASIDKMFEAEGSGSVGAIDKHMESEEGRIVVAGGGGGSSSESTPSHCNLTPSRQPMIPGPDSRQKWQIMRDSKDYLEVSTWRPHNWRNNQDELYEVWTKKIKKNKMIFNANFQQL